MSTQKNNGEESKEPDYDEANDQLEEEQEEAGAFELYYRIEGIFA
jgi:hypothetical protein